jgi:hypothetical protein
MLGLGCVLFTSVCDSEARFLCLPTVKSNRKST